MRLAPETLRLDDFWWLLAAAGAVVALAFRD